MKSNKSFILFSFSAAMLMLSICCGVSLCLAAETTPMEAVASTCDSYRFSSSPTNKEFESCSHLPALNSFIQWTFYPSTLTGDIAFRQTGTSPTSWVAWSRNPTGQTMLGSQSLVAFHDSQGLPTALTTQINSYNPSMQNTNLTFGVSNLRTEYSNGDMIIFATLKTNQIWQEGPMSGGDSFGMHPMSATNQRSVGTIDFSTGAITAASVSPHSNRVKNIHGVLNAVSWGIMMPVGVMIARYLKVFQVANLARFHLHRACQTSANAIGVVGWATGMKLGGGSHGITYNKHRILGITLFTCATLQVLALLMRPNPDYKYRLYWYIYHHVIGYTTVVMSIVNVYEGLHILQPDPIWATLYAAIVLVLGASAVVLEAVT